MARPCKVGEKSFMLQKITVTPQAEGVELEKARVAVIFQGDTQSLSDVLAQLQKEHLKRNGGNTDEKFSAIIAVMPFYDGMEMETVTRTRKIYNTEVRDGKEIRVDTGQTEEYESARRFIDPDKISLSRLGYAADPNRPFFVKVSLFDTPGKSVASEGEGNDESDDEGSEDTE